MILDNTMSTLGDLIGFEGFLNTSTPFSTAGYKVKYKTDRHYLDFNFSNTFEKQCDYPRFWNDSGQRVLAKDDSTFAKLDGCFDSDFDQVGTRYSQKHQLINIILTVWRLGSIVSILRAYFPVLALLTLAHYVGRERRLVPYGCRLIPWTCCACRPSKLRLRQGAAVCPESRASCDFTDWALSGLISPWIRSITKVSTSRG